MSKANTNLIDKLVAGQINLHPRQVRKYLKDANAIDFLERSKKIIKQKKKLDRIRKRLASMIPWVNKKENK